MRGTTVSLTFRQGFSIAFRTVAVRELKIRFLRGIRLQAYICSRPRLGEEALVIRLPHIITGFGVRSGNKLHAAKSCGKQEEKFRTISGTPAIKAIGTPDWIFLPSTKEAEDAPALHL